MLPYLIGAILLFGAVNITAYVVETFALDETNKEAEEDDSTIINARKDAEDYASSHTAEEIRERRNYALKQIQLFSEMTDSELSLTEYEKILSNYLK